MIVGVISVGVMTVGSIECRSNDIIPFFIAPSVFSNVYLENTKRS